MCAINRVYLVTSNMVHFLGTSPNWHHASYTQYVANSTKASGVCPHRKLSSTPRRILAMCMGMGPSEFPKNIRILV
jgi:hypothetical protein